MKSHQITNKPLTRKQSAFVKHLIEHPKDSSTEAVMQTYDVKSRQTAESIAYENLRKPEIVTELAKYNSNIEQIIVDKTFKLSSSEKLEEVKEGLLNARWMHDKINGKAKQLTEVTSTKLSINIDLTGNQE